MIYYGIPTYKRSEKQPTLDYLERVGVKKEQIIMAVQTEEDNELYRRQGYDKRVGTFIFRNAENLSENANSILRIIPKNEKIIIFDDDIKFISRLDNGVLVPIETKEEFDRFIDYGYSIADKLRTIGFSVYPCHNAYFMSNTYHDTHIGEGTMLALRSVGIEFDRWFETKCDYDLTCRIIQKYGKYPRLNMYACNAPHYTKGGCEENWENRNRVLYDANKLVNMYPEYLKENTKRQGEVLMRRIGKKVNV